MRYARCDRCQEYTSVRYVVSPFRHVGAFCLCDECRHNWLAIQERPFMDRVRPLVESEVQAAMLQQAASGRLSVRTIYFHKS